MGIILKINVNQVIPLLEFYTQRAKSLTDKLEEVQRELDEINLVISELEVHRESYQGSPEWISSDVKNFVKEFQERRSAVSQEEKQVKTPFGLTQNSLFYGGGKGNVTTNYDTSFPWTRKAKFFIEQLGPLTTAQIAENILTLEPELSRKKVVSSLSATLSQKIGEKGEFVRSPAPSGEFRYDLKNRVISEAVTK